MPALLWTVWREPLSARRSFCLCFLAFCSGLSSVLVSHLRCWLMTVLLSSHFHVSDSSTPENGLCPRETSPQKVFRVPMSNACFYPVSFFLNFTFPSWYVLLQVVCLLGWALCDTNTGNIRSFRPSGRQGKSHFIVEEVKD